jgi:RNA polymerase sigma factor (sigma-70 family)
VSIPAKVSSIAPAPPYEAPADETRWFKEEVQTHEPLLRAYLRRKFPKLHDVDDVVQESYLRLLKVRVSGTLRSAKGLLFTTARNAALDVFRHKGVVPMESLTDNPASPVYAHGVNAAEAASLSQEIALLLEAMDQLPDRCRLILVLRRFHGLSHKEIAERLSISENVIQKQITLGLKQCHTYLERHGVKLGQP